MGYPEREPSPEPPPSFEINGITWSANSRYFYVAYEHCIQVIFFRIFFSSFSLPLILPSGVLPQLWPPQPQGARR